MRGDALIAQISAFNSVYGVDSEPWKILVSHARIAVELDYARTVNLLSKFYRFRSHEWRLLLFLLAAHDAVPAANRVEHLCLLISLFLRCSWEEIDAVVRKCQWPFIPVREPDDEITQFFGTVDLGIADCFEPLLLEVFSLPGGAKALSDMLSLSKAKTFVPYLRLLCIRPRAILVNNESGECVAVPVSAPPSAAHLAMEEFLRSHVCSIPNLVLNAPSTKQVVCILNFLRLMHDDIVEMHPVRAVVSGRAFLPCYMYKYPKVKTLRSGSTDGRLLATLVHNSPLLTEVHLAFDDHNLTTTALACLAFLPKLRKLSLDVSTVCSIIPRLLL